MTPDEDKLELRLKKGTNHLLMKVINEGGPSGFCFTSPADDDRIPAEVLAAIHETAKARSPEQLTALRQYYRLQVGDAPSYSNWSSTSKR